MYKGLYAPLYETNRLFIRNIDINDNLAFYKVCSNKNVTRFLSFNQHSNIHITSKVINNMLTSYFAGRSINFAIIYKHLNELIGSISLTFDEGSNSAEIGYLLAEEYWNMGLTTEATKAIIELAKSYYHLNFVIIKHIKENIASQKVIEKCGFQYVNSTTTFHPKFQRKVEILQYILYL